MPYRYLWSAEARRCLPVLIRTRGMPGDTNNPDLQLSSVRRDDEGGANRTNSCGGCGWLATLNSFSSGAGSSVAYTCLPRHHVRYLLPLPY